MSVIGWQGRLNEASTPEAVAEVCRIFLASMPPEALAEVPASCTPPQPLALEDVSPYALTLIRQLGMGDRASAPVLHGLTTVFTKAALRLAQISTQAAAMVAEQRRSRSD